MGCVREGFRLIHFSVQSNHLHPHDPSLLGLAWANQVRGFSDCVLPHPRISDAGRRGFSGWVSIAVPATRSTCVGYSRRRSARQAVRGRQASG
jgi:hypothetical protein